MVDLSSESLDERVRYANSIIGDLMILYGGSTVLPGYHGNGFNNDSVLLLSSLFALTIPATVLCQ